MWVLEIKPGFSMEDSKDINCGDRSPASTCLFEGYVRNEKVYLPLVLCLIAYTHIPQFLKPGYMKVVKKIDNSKSL